MNTLSQVYAAIAFVDAFNPSATSYGLAWGDGRITLQGRPRRDREVVISLRDGWVLRRTSAQPGGQTVVAMTRLNPRDDANFIKFLAQECHAFLSNP